MEKKRLIKKVNIFLNQASQANCYFLIIKQFNQNRSKYHQEMNLSNAFYSYTYNALVVATFMELSKIYDSHKSSTNIQKLVKESQENIAFFPTYLSKERIEMDGKGYEYELPFHHTIKDSEKNFFREEVEKNKKLEKMLDSKEMPSYVEMSIDRYFELYNWRLKQIEPQITNLLKQRNKVYAHNDEANMKLSLDNIINSFPLDYKEIEELLSFALDFCQFAYAMLTNINKSIAPININDWENTLALVELGEKYQEIETQKKIEEFKKDLNI
ncbi:hypothetical protein [Enterococcus plantarum]|uniref:AbiU2 domain-containing protein n=1 Tax=Enterococcus plantarum TaxID=1077675 RepID=UPI001A8D1386|nr:hypothetical protein [Enterococcus plantarum]MBO0422298.1 hypothetical protein [Enterococcus plantarum]